MPHLKINNATYYYEISGQGEPVILISGYTRDHEGWLPITDELSKYYQLCVFDNLGIGQTKNDGKMFSVEDMAQDIMTMASALHFFKPHIVGASMGGTIAQSIASQFPDKMGKLCLLTTSSHWRQAMLRTFDYLLKLRERGLDFDFIFNATIPFIYGEDFLKDEKKISQLKQSILANQFPQSLEDQKRQYQVLSDFDGRENLKKIKAPTLIVYGKQDIVSLPYESHFLASHIAGAKSIELNCAHGVILEASRELANALQVFLAH